MALPLPHYMPCDWIGPPLNPDMVTRNRLWAYRTGEQDDSGQILLCGVSIRIPCGLQRGNQ